MKNRKGSVLALAALATGLGTIGAAWAAPDDDKSPVHQAMEKVQAKDSFIKKNYKTAALFKKNQKDVADAAKDLVTALKSVRDDAGPAKDQKKTQKEWTDLMDPSIKAAETYATDVAKDGVTHTQAKEKYSAVAKTCTACHDVFRKDD